MKLLAAGSPDRPRMLTRDQRWLSSVVSVVCGPFDMPSAETLRAAVARFSHDFPRTLWRPDTDGAHWIADRDPDDVVVEHDWNEAGVGAVLDDIVDDDDLALPLTVIRYPNHIGVKMSHGLGDGQSFLLVPAAILLTAIAGEPPKWPLRRSGPFPLAIAAGRTFGRHPGRIRAALDDRISVSETPGSGLVQDFTPARTTIHVSLDRDKAAALFELGGRRFPGASRFALQVTAVLNALRAASVEVSSEVRIVMDLRRYLDWAPIDGNFLAGVPMALEAGMSPEAVSQCISRTTKSARPLAGQLVSVLRRTGAPAPVTAFDPAAPPRMTFSNLGRIPMLEALPYLPGQRVDYGGSVDPEGPHGITVLMGENSGTLTIDLVFHSTVISAERIGAAMDLLSADPTAVFMQTSDSP